MEKDFLSTVQIPPQKPLSLSEVLLQLRLLGFRLSISSRQQIIDDDYCTYLQTKCSHHPHHVYKFSLPTPETECSCTNGFHTDEWGDRILETERALCHPFVDAMTNRSIQTVRHLMKNLKLTLPVEEEAPLPHTSTTKSKLPPRLPELLLFLRLIGFKRSFPSLQRGVEPCFIYLKVTCGYHGIGYKLVLASHEMRCSCKNAPIVNTLVPVETEIARVLSPNLTISLDMTNNAIVVVRRLIQKLSHVTEKMIPKATMTSSVLFPPVHTNITGKEILDIKDRITENKNDLQRIINSLDSLAERGFVEQPKAILKRPSTEIAKTEDTSIRKPDRKLPAIKIIKEESNEQKSESKKLSSRRGSFDARSSSSATIKKEPEKQIPGWKKIFPRRGSFYKPKVVSFKSQETTSPKYTKLPSPKVENPILEIKSSKTSTKQKPQKRVTIAKEFHNVTKAATTLTRQDSKKQSDIGKYQHPKEDKPSTSQKGESPRKEWGQQRSELNKQSDLGKYQHSEENKPSTSRKSESPRKEEEQKSEPRKQSGLGKYEYHEEDKPSTSQKRESPRKEEGQQKSDLGRYQYPEENKPSTSRKSESPRKEEGQQKSDLGRYQYPEENKPSTRRKSESPRKEEGQQRSDLGRYQYPEENKPSTSRKSESPEKEEEQKRKEKGYPTSTEATKFRGTPSSSKKQYRSTIQRSVETGVDILKTPKGSITPPDWSGLQSPMPKYSPQSDKSSFFKRTKSMSDADTLKRKSPKRTRSWLSFDHILQKIVFSSLFRRSTPSPPRSTRPSAGFLEGESSQVQQQAVNERSRKRLFSSSLDRGRTTESSPKSESEPRRLHASLERERPPRSEESISTEGRTSRERERRPQHTNLQKETLSKSTETHPSAEYESRQLSQSRNQAMIERENMPSTSQAREQPLAEIRRNVNDKAPSQSTEQAEQALNESLPSREDKRKSQDEPSDTAKPH